MLSLKIQSSSQTAHRSARPGPVREGRAGARMRGRGGTPDGWEGQRPPKARKGPSGPRKDSYNAEQPAGKGKGALGPSENGNALHERNGLSSHGLHRSTFGDGELNCRVRHGTG